MNLHHIIPSNYKTELAEAKQLLGIDSELTLTEFESPKHKWFELGIVGHRKTGFLRVPNLQIIFNSTLKPKETK